MSYFSIPSWGSGIQRKEKEHPKVQKTQLTRQHTRRLKIAPNFSAFRKRPGSLGRPDVFGSSLSACGPGPPWNRSGWAGADRCPLLKEEALAWLKPGGLLPQAPLDESKGRRGWRSRSTAGDGIVGQLCPLPPPCTGTRCQLCPHHGAGVQIGPRT